MATENNPERYSEMSKPRTSEDADHAIDAFFTELRALRARHRITDVHVVVRVIVERGGDESPAFSTMHCGAIQEAEGMCAYAFARSAEDRRRFVDWHKTSGAKSAGGA